MNAESIEPTGSAYEFPLLIRDLLHSGVSRAPEQEIVYADKKRMTYREFGERVSRLAAGLTALSVKAGDTVAVMDWDTHRYLECFFAVPMIGAVLHTINVRLSAEQILFTINHADDSIILVNSEFIPILEQIWDRVDPGKKLLLLSDDGAAPHVLFTFVAEYEAMLAASPASFDFPDLHENARATTFYTTGTTGLPKGVYFSHRQLVLHTLAVRCALAGNGQGRFNAGDVYMPITPMFHVHAWGIPYVATSLGVKQVYPGRYIPDHLLGLIEREKVNFSHCVPTILQMILRSANAKGVDLSGWTVVTGGAALTQSLAKQALDMGIDIFSGYGMSETCPIVTLAQLDPHMLAWDHDRQAEWRCKAGRPIHTVALRIVDDLMRDVPHDGASTGEIVLRTPWLTQGYLKDAKNSENLWKGGWLHTGDIAVVEPNGYVKITDRLKDVIKTGGEWVSSLDLENLIVGMPGVAEAAVIGVPDAKWGERPLAIVAANPGQEISEADIRARLGDFAAKGTISRYSVPERIVIVESLPKTSVGKLDKKALRAKYGQPI
jgi:fatty-acyl-CoA synthase